MPYKKPKIEKHFFAIGEVAQMIGESTSTLRYWENQFDFLQPQKNKKGNRLFTREDIETVKFIHYLVKIQGLTINGAKQKLKNHHDEAVHNFEIVKKLEEIKLELTSLEEALGKTTT